MPAQHRGAAGRERPHHPHLIEGEPAVLRPARRQEMPQDLGNGISGGRDTEETEEQVQEPARTATPEMRGSNDGAR
jgi:hypothetical protein